MSLTPPSRPISPAEPAIAVAGLTYRYPGAAEPALAGLDFEVGRGEIFGFLGPNGAGKSTTQKILIGLLEGFGGEVSVLDRPVAAWGSELYERIGVAFEFPNHYLKLTGRENLAYFAALYGGSTVPPQELLEQVDLADAAEMPVGQYSKGMKTRLGLARALVHGPELLFLDEPTTGLDPVSARRIKRLVSERREKGTTVFLTTHDMTVANELCDRVAFIVEGEIALVGAPRALELEHGTPKVRVEHGTGGETVRSEFPLAGLGENAEFSEILRSRPIQTIHTLEATLEEVFVAVTGKRLR